MTNFYERAINMIQESDMVLEVLDARFPQLTRIHSLEAFTTKNNKQLVFILNKADLITKKNAEEIKGELGKIAPCIFVSASKKKGISRLREYMMKKIKKGKISVIGYPNTGKSSLINALLHKRVAKTSIKAGFTRGQQLVKIKDGVYIIDLPGVVPYGDTDVFNSVIVGAKNIDQIKDVEGVGIQFMQYFIKRFGKEWIEKKFKIKIEKSDDENSILEKIAFAQNRVHKKGIPDIHSAIKKFVWEWQKGEL